MDQQYRDIVMIVAIDDNTVVVCYLLHKSRVVDVPISIAKKHKQKNHKLIFEIIPSRLI